MSQLVPGSKQEHLQSKIGQRENQKLREQITDCEQAITEAIMPSGSPMAKRC